MAFTSQAPVTPGFFTAAIQAENDNLFDSAFGKGDQSPRTQAQYFDQTEPSFFAPINPRGFPPLPYGARDSTLSDDTSKMNLNGWDFGEKDSRAHRYPDPPLVRSNASPPYSTSASPDWAFRDFQNQATGPSSLQTSNIGVDPRLQYGQITPPDDNDESKSLRLGPPFASRPSDSAEQIPSPARAGKPSRSSKRKRTNTSTAGEQGQMKSSQASKPAHKTLCSRNKKEEDNHMSATEANEAEGGKEDKRSKFLERNRVAASKCRQKKKEWTTNLEAKARQLQTENTRQVVMINSLKEELMFLKGEMLNHTECGSPNIRNYLAREATAIAIGEDSFSPGAMARRRAAINAELAARKDDDVAISEEDASSRRQSVASGATGPGTTEGDEESVIGEDGEVRNAS